VSKEIDAHLRSDISVCFILSQCRCERCEEKDKPRDSDFGKHFKVQPFADSRVQGSTHEEVVDWVACYFVLCAGDECLGVNYDGDDEARKDCNRHD